MNANLKVYLDTVSNYCRIPILNVLNHIGHAL